MRLTKRLLPLVLLTALLGFGASATCYAQGTRNTIAASSSPSAQDSETAKQLEIALIRLDASEKREALANQRLAEKDAVIRAREDQLAVKDEVIVLLKSINADRTQVNTGDARVLQACNTQLAKAEARIYELEHPGVLRSLFDKRSLGGFMAGWGANELKRSFER